MDIKETGELSAFRKEVREWVRANLPGDLDQPYTYRGRENDDKVDAWFDILAAIATGKKAVDMSIFVRITGAPPLISVFPLANTGLLFNQPFCPGFADNPDVVPDAAVDDQLPQLHDREPLNSLVVH